MANLKRHEMTVKTVAGKVLEVTPVKLVAGTPVVPTNIELGSE